MAKKILANTLVLLILSINLNGQSVRDEPPPLRERIFFSGNMGLQFGTYTNIQFAPAVGIWLLPRLSVAAGGTYQFYKDPFGRTDLYGPRVYTEFLFVRDLNNLIPLGVGGSLCTHLEYDGLSLKRDFWQGTGETGRMYVNSLLAGIGFNQPVGPRSFMTLTVLWELTDSDYELYGTPEIRIGFRF
jgi:hypothetical protein